MRIFILVLVFAALAGCASPDKRSVEARWTNDAIKAREMSLAATIRGEK